MPGERTAAAFGIIAILLGFIFALEDSFAANANWFGAGFILLGYAFLDSCLGFPWTYNLKTGLFVVLLIFNIRSSILTNYVYAGKANELISQVHTTPEYDGIVRKIRKEFELVPEDIRPQMLVSGEAVWPTVWYMRGLPLRYDATPEQKKDFAYILQDWKENPAPGDIPEGFEAQKIRLRGWWVPDYSQMTIKRFLGYAINHIPWKPAFGGDPSGYSYVTLLIRKKS